MSSTWLTAGISSRFSGARLVDEHHERRRVVLLEPLAGRLGEDRRRERAERLAVLDPRVEDVLHVVPARVGDDRAVAERARAELHPPLEPADDVAVGDPLGDVREERVVVQALGRRSPAARIAASRARRRRTAGPCRRAPSRTRAAGRAPGSRRSTRRRPRCRSRRRRAGRRRPRTAVSGRMRPFATAFSATPPARQRFFEPVRRCAARTRWRYASSSIACSAAATSSWCVRQLGARLARGAEGLLHPVGEEAADRRRLLVPRHVDAFLVVHEVVELELEEVAVELDELAHRSAGSARGRRRARGPSPCPRRRTSGSRATA